MHLGYLQLRQTIEDWRSRGPESVRLAAAPESMKPPPVPSDNPAYAGISAISGTAEPNGTNGSPNVKRENDDPSLGNREREKRRRYD